MTSIDVPRNQVQLPNGGINSSVLGSIFINKRIIGNVNTNANAIAYQVPAGKQAIMKSTVWIVDNYGSEENSQFGFLDASTTLFVTVGFRQKFPDTGTQFFIPQEIVLEEGDKVGFSPTLNANNGSNDISFTIEEIDL